MFKKSLTTFFVASSVYFMPADAGFAHEGHGLSGPHLHAGDWIAVAALVVAVGVAIYLSRGKK